MQLSFRNFTDDDVGYMTFRQAEIFEEVSGFASEGWRDYIIGEVREFIDRFDAEKDRVFILEADGVRSGCMAVTHRENNAAQLRFLFIEPDLRGSGIGSRMFGMAVDFCRSKGYDLVFLWTVSHLRAARRIYADHGFHITETKDNDDWGTHVLEERWDLDLRG
ncbi:MAG: GNAT family N-acetyltransferase [Methanomassiliicoccaceae archaeon]|jgi:GNAT superfamily N-acetyltransferase|nr:GNAT family N-acetyltransferase [Methanomassiliicoccaceae archaeon]